MFGYNVNTRLINTVILVLFVIGLSRMSTDQWMQLLLTLPAVLIAISCHEFAHAYRAVKYGDNTPREEGRLTLNPLKHLDWMGSFLMVFTHIGWGRPVNINPNNFTSNKSRGYCEMQIALAGPLTNLFLAIIFITAEILLFSLAPETFLKSNIGIAVLEFVELSVSVNIGLGVFNLIPLPPLDGEKIFKNLLPYKAKEWLDANTYTLQFIFIIFWIFGVLDVVVAPIIAYLHQGLYLVIGYAIDFILSLF